MPQEIDYQAILDTILADVRPLAARGKVADYIPELGRVDPNKLGIALATVDGRYYSAGDADERFSIQSISKLFTLIMAHRLIGNDLWQRVGKEPSGTPFNSLVQLENDHGIPRNPFINAGALVVTDILCSHYVGADRAILEFLRRLTGAMDINFDNAVAASEAAHGHRNAAMANFIKSFGNLKAPVDIVLNSYFRQCSITMSCRELAHAALLLANHGSMPVGDKSRPGGDQTRTAQLLTRHGDSSGSRGADSNEPGALLTSSEAKRISAIMLTCGTYDAAGDFAYRVGLPAKSGVGGGIVAILPGELALCVWSPPLDENGNSLAGTMALELFTTLTGQSIF
jgi:glutaminase